MGWRKWTYEEKIGKNPHYALEFGDFLGYVGMEFNYIYFIPTFLSKRGDKERIF